MPKIYWRSYFASLRLPLSLALVASTFGIVGSASAETTVEPSVQVTSVTCHDLETDTPAEVSYVGDGFDLGDQVRVLFGVPAEEVDLVDTVDQITDDNPFRIGGLVTTVREEVVTFDDSNAMVGTSFAVVFVNGVKVDTVEVTVPACVQEEPGGEVIDDGPDKVIDPAPEPPVNESTDPRDDDGGTVGDGPVVLERLEVLGKRHAFGGRKFGKATVDHPCQGSIQKKVFTKRLKNGKVVKVNSKWRNTRFNEFTRPGPRGVFWSIPNHLLNKRVAVRSICASDDPTISKTGAIRLRS